MKSETGNRSLMLIAAFSLNLFGKLMTPPDASALQGQSAQAFESEVARLIVSALSLEVSPEEIDPEAPLFGDGLGLDSIDALEISLVISKAYGVQLRSDDERNHRIFASLRSLAGHIAKQRAG
jgi:acyl carrier protein